MSPYSPSGRAALRCLGTPKESSMIASVPTARPRVPARVLLIGAALLSPWIARADSAAEIDRMAQSTLQALYAQKPSAERAVREAAGYAVFSDMSTKILFAGGGGGKGVAVNQGTGNRTYMLMVSVSAGLGMGISKSHLVWVFQTQRAYDN